MKPKTKRPLLTLGLTLLLSGIIYTALSTKPTQVELTQVKRGTFHEVIRIEGTLRSKERHIVSAFADGDIKSITLHVGDAIKKGQRITELIWDMNYEPLTSPMEGVISKVFRDSAGPIRRGEPLIEVINPNHLEVILELLTPDATRVSPGDLAFIDHWGGAEALTAQVRNISRAGFTKSSALGVEEERTEVTLDLIDIPEHVEERLGSHFHVDVAVEISSTPDALIIPEGALFRDGTAWSVYQVQDHRAHRKQVHVHKRAEGWAHIGDEIHEGDWIIVYPGDLIREGTRVQSHQD